MSFRSWLAAGNLVDSERLGLVYALSDELDGGVDLIVRMQCVLVAGPAGVRTLEPGRRQAATQNCQAE